MPREYYQLSDLNLGELNRIFDSIARRLNFLADDGDNISCADKKFTNLATGVSNSDAIRKDQTFLLDNLASIILGTTDEITITDNGDETITISLPVAIKLDGATATRLLATDGSKKTVSVANLASWIAGTANKVAVIDDTDGTITLSFASPTRIASAANIIAGNYTEIEADGTLLAVGNASVYDDLYFEIAPKTTGAGKPTLASFSGNINQWQMAVNNITELRPTEIKHGWEEATQLEIHVHWVTNGSDGTDRGVKWEIDYTWSNILPSGGTTAFASATTTSAETQIPLNTPDKTYMYTSVVSFTPTGGKINSGLLMSLKRIASVTDPTPSNDPWVIMVGVHYEINTLGSRTMTSK